MDYLMNNPEILSIAVAAVVFMIVMGFGYFAFAGRSKMKEKERIGRVQYRPPSKDAIEDKARKMQLRRQDTRVDSLASSILPKPANMRDKLDKTGTSMSLGAYLVLCLMTAAGALLTFRYGLGLPFIAAMLAAVGVGLLLPYMIIGFMVKRRAKKFIKNFPDALEVMIRGIKSGLPVTETFRVIADEMDGPVAEEFGRMVDNIQFGREFDDVLWDVAKRIDVPEYRFFAIAIGIQRETGGNLAETLGNLTDVLRGRGRVKLKIKAYSGEAKASAYIIGSLPFLMFGIIYTLNQSYVMQLFTDTRGWFMLGAAATSLGTGIGIMVKMIRFEI